MYNILRKNFRYQNASTDDDKKNLNDNLKKQGNQNIRENQTIKNPKPKNREEFEVMTQFKKMMQWLISLEEEQTNKADNKKEIPQF